MMNDNRRLIIIKIEEIKLFSIKNIDRSVLVFINKLKNNPYSVKELIIYLFF